MAYSRNMTDSIEKWVYSNSDKCPMCEQVVTMTEENHEWIVECTECSFGFILS